MLHNHPWISVMVCIWNSRVLYVALCYWVMPPISDLVSSAPSRTIPAFPSRPRKPVKAQALDVPGQRNKTRDPPCRVESILAR
jgi:hypothetical protein